MAKIRVLRLLEYVYDDVERCERDMANWHVQGSWRPNAWSTIRSVTLPFEVLDEGDPRAKVDPAPPTDDDRIRSGAEAARALATGRTREWTPDPKDEEYVDAASQVLHNQLSVRYGISAGIVAPPWESMSETTKEGMRDAVRELLVWQDGGNVDG